MGTILFMTATSEFLFREEGDTLLFLLLHYKPGHWGFPKGHVEAGETDEQALVRGIREEAGIDITVGKYLAPYITPTGKKAKWYECFAKTDNIIPGSDLEDAKFVPKEQVLKIVSKRVPLWPKEIIEYFS